MKAMTNKELAKIFYEMADFLEIENEDGFRVSAYRRAATSLESLEESVEEIYKRGGVEALQEISGIGKSIALKIEEYIERGEIEAYEKLKQETPVEMKEMTKIEGVGPKTVRTLFEKLDVRSMDELEKAAKENRIAPLFGFDEKTEKNILEGIEFLKESKGRFRLGEILPRARKIREELRRLPEVERVDMAGSLRRMKETVGDVDLLVASEDPEKVMDRFVSLPGVLKIWGKGRTKSSVRVAEGFDVDLRVIPSESYGAALQYFTGSKEHNISLRKVAMEKDFKVNEYGVFKGEEKVAGESEEEVYRILGMEWTPPELREGKGEIEAALDNSLPELVNSDDIKGDLHCHTNWSGGEHSIEEMALRARELGYDYLGVADHTKELRIENGLDEERLRRQREEIEEVNSKFKNQNLKLRVFQGCEANILKNGSIDIDDEVLKELDFVIAGIHSYFKMEEEEITERMIRAMKNPYVDVVSHPCGRLIGMRDAYSIDLERVLKIARETGTVMEVNASPARFDLNDLNIRRAKEKEVKMIINTDAHHKSQMEFMEQGVAQARRGWAKKDDILNTKTSKNFLGSLKRNRFK